MQPITTLISPEGEWMAPRSSDFLSALGDVDPNVNILGYAVKNFGLIKIETIEQLVVEIELHPRNVSLPALLATQQFLLSVPVSLFRIKYLDDSWHSEISGSAEHAMKRLSELCNSVSTDPRHDRFEVQGQDLGLLFQDHYNPMRPLAQKWRAAFGIFDSTVIPLAAEHGLLSRLMIAGITRKAEPTWRFLGDGHQWIGTEYRLHGLGEKVTNMPDKDYGGWATEFYKSVAETGRPRYDVVRGAVHYEDESGKPLKPVHYERLMLPWRTPSDEVFVTMVSRRFGTDDIPSLDFDA